MTTQKAPPTHGADAAVPAGVAVTLLHLQLTVDPREAGQARARIAALSCVHAGGAVHAGMVMGAEVQIWQRQREREKSVCLQGRKKRKRKKPSTPDVPGAMNGTLQRKPNLLMLSS